MNSENPSNTNRCWRQGSAHRSCTPDKCVVWLCKCVYPFSNTHHPSTEVCICCHAEEDMGVEFALVHDETKEAFDLGRWCGSSWDGVPSSLEAMRSYFVEFYADEASTALVWLVSQAVWGFIVGHPGCRLVNEHADVWWGVTPNEGHVRAWGEANVFRQVASRYDIQSSFDASVREVRAT